jgi:tetratricopeptide (TPR) repeat protein
MRLWQGWEEGDKGRLELTVGELKDFQVKNASGWQFGQAMALLGDLQLELKEFTDAEKTFRSLAESPVSSEIRLAASLKLAQMPSWLKRAPDAIKQVQTIIEQQPQGSLERSRAQITLAECLAADKRLSEARQLLRRVIDEAKDNRLKGEAYNSLGRCYLFAEPADAVNLHEARWAFLFVDLIYNQNKEDQAQALYYLAQIFERLNEPERARECTDVLLADRPFLGTPYQIKALREQK